MDQNWIVDLTARPFIRRFGATLALRTAQPVESLAIREGKSERSIRMTLSLAFMSPALAVRALAIADPDQDRHLMTPRWRVGFRAASASSA